MVANMAIASLDAALDLPTIKITTNSTVGESNSDSDSTKWWNGKKWWRGKANIPNASHPHLGARLWDEINQQELLQMIVDPSPRRLLETSNAHIDNDVLCPDQTHGIEGSLGLQALLKIRPSIEKYNSNYGQNYEGGSTDTAERRSTRSKILCMVYTVDLPYARESLQAIAQTWGPKCDGFIAASNVTDHSIGAIDLIHQGPEKYNNMWQKIRTMWAYAYDNYLDDFDFFHICGDDVYLVMENMRSFLDGPDIVREEKGYLNGIAREASYVNKTNRMAKRGRLWQNRTDGLPPGPRPLMIGQPCPYKQKGEIIFPLGGAGYTLNRAAVDLFGREGLRSWMADTVDSREDIFIGGFFEGKGVYLTHVLDRKGGWRYETSADRTAQYRKNKPTQNQIPVLTRKFGIEPGEGLDSISEEMAGFHLKYEKSQGTLKKHNKTVAELLHRYHAILYDLCPTNVQ
jgi:glycoprotein-N-acetylgalactosamine 3-beta-galactosyltransferase